MAAKNVIVVFVFFFLAISVVSATLVKSDWYCVICHRNCSRNSNGVRNIDTHLSYLASCFGVSHDGPGVICSYCRRAIFRHRSTGETFFHLVDTQRQTKTGRRTKRKWPSKKHENHNSTVEEFTWIGTIKRRPNGEVILPPGVFEEIENITKSLSGRCDLPSEVKMVKDKIYQEFTVKKKEPIYDPEEFKSFCSSAGAHTLFDTIHMAVTSERHSSNRTELNKQRTVYMIYKMCFCLSQVCNALQVDHALYLSSSNVNQECMDTEYQLGNTCCRKTGQTTSYYLATTHAHEIENLFAEAIQNEWLVIMIVDDYTSIHTNRRPEVDIQSTCNNMCTIVVKIFKEIKAIKLPPNIQMIHDPQGVNIRSCLQLITSAVSMSQLSHTYASTMPNWLTNTFFNPELERQRLTEHQYCEGNSVRLMRKMDNLHLLNFVQLRLKSKEDFAAAHDISLATGLKNYLKKFVVVQPGDWPCQFYTRQSIYEYLPQNVSNHNSTSQVTNDEHIYSAPPSSEPSLPASHNNHSYVPLSAVTSIVPTIGPLHISLNSREHVLLSFHPFFKTVYEYLFPHSKLAEKPKPWRISLLLEIVYGAWTLIRDNVKSAFQNSKDLQYGALLNLLDNYLPLVLTIYTITFKMNNFSEYYNAMIRIWVMFTCLKRKHYNKAPLVWFSNIAHWGSNFKDLYNLVRQWLVVMDEYPVENTHSILRAQTKPTDTAEQLTNKAKSIFMSKERQANFRSQFTPAKQFTFSSSQLKFLKVKCAKFLTNIISNIHSNPQSASFVNTKSPNKEPSHVILPHLFGKVQMKCTVLPLGYQAKNPPDENCKCDLPCNIENQEEPWVLFPGCWHSFHQVCLSDPSYCPICKETLETKVKELAKTAKDAILNPGSKEGGINYNINTTEGPQEMEMDNVNIPSHENVEDLDISVQNLNKQISALQPLTPPSHAHKTPVQTRGLESEKVPPHCTTCCHPMKGHSRPKTQELAQCNYCPEKTCTKNLNRNCSCPWHKNQQKDPPSSTLQVTRQESHDNQQFSSPANHTFVTVIRNDLPGSTEWILPSNISQSNIFGYAYGSNACTIISVLVSLNFLSGKLKLPRNAEELIPASNIFGESMKSGNILHHMLNRPIAQPNLEVREVIDLIQGLKLTIEQDLGFFSSDDMIEKFEHFFTSGNKVAGVLIVPPDKSMAIVMNNRVMGVFESHEHGDNGGIISVCHSGDVRDFVAYLALMVQRDWGGSLDGANFTKLRK